LIAYIVNRFEPNSKLWEIAKDLKRNYKLGLLTNMYPNMLNLIIKKKLIPDLKWDAIVDSSIVGFVKPQKEIYELATKEAESEPNRILFIENSEMHMKGAQAIGWNTFLYDPVDTVLSNKNLLNFIG